MSDVVIYSKIPCPYCVRAKMLLQRKGVKFTEILIDENPEKCEEMIQKSNRRTVPQIFINGQHIGGCDDMYALDKTGQLDELLKG